MRFVFIHAHTRIFHIITMCRVLEVSRAGYYAWRARPLCERVKENRWLRERIRQIHQEVRGRYGSPRVHQELRALGIACGKHRVARLMRAEGLRGQEHAAIPRDHAVGPRGSASPPTCWRDGSQSTPAAAPDRVWVADITYIPTREGWLYLAVLLDLASRRVVGWALRTRLDHELTLTALRMALTHRGARGGLHHSDRGVQYASRAYHQAAHGGRLHAEHESRGQLLGQCGR